MTFSYPRSILVLLGAGALGACATPNFPTTRETAAAPTAPAPVAARAQEPAARPSEAIEAQPLPAAPPPAAVESRPLPPPAPVGETPRARAQPEFRTVTTRSVTGRVVDVDGPARTYTVKKGDNLTQVAERLDTDVEQLAKDNRLKKPYRLQPGDKLKGPATTAKAYVVGSGDTLFSIGRRFGVSAEALRAENGLSRNVSLSSGRRLRLPPGYRDRGPIVTTSRERVDGGQTEVAERPAPSRATAAPRPDPQDAPVFRTVAERSVTGRVVDVDGPPKTYRVRKGDNLTEVAERLDTDVEQLAKDNRLKRPYRLQPGQVLKGPSSTARAYVVGAGDTLAEIGQRFGVSVSALRSANGLSRRAGVEPGRRLRLPAGYRDRGPVVTARVPTDRTEPSVRMAEATPPRAEPPARLPSGPQPYAGRPTPPPRVASRPLTATPGLVPGAPVASPPVSDSALSQMGRGVFIWPVRGDVIEGFGPRGPGQRNDGLNIRAQPGDPVHAAAGGDVVYAGDQVPGFGNLVLIKHADGWVTAYGHLSRVDVRMQQKVVQGQPIGQAGATGGVTEPQLHFEVRYAPTPEERARPIDPSLVLPR